MRVRSASKLPVVTSFQVSGREGRARLQPAGALEALLRGVGCDVEQQCRQAGVRDMGGDLGPHRACAKHRD